MKDLYYILGTERDCSPAELTAAYRKLAQKLQAPGQEQDYFLDRHFEDITEAYQILSDTAQRRKYDAAFKKQQQRSFYPFKLRHINIAVTLVLLTLTCLFGYYVMESLSGSKTKKIAVVQPILPPVVPHVKKKYKHKTIVSAKTEKAPVEIKDEEEAKPEDVAKPAAPIQKIAPVENPKPVAEKKWVSTNTQSPVINGYAPADEEKAPIPAVPSASNTATLEGNVTGLIYLHQTASYRSAVVSSIPNHSQVLILERNQGFYKISFNNQVGYVPKWTVREQ